MSRKFTWFIVAACIYAGFISYLYHPYFQVFDKWQRLLPVNLWLAALGCFVLSGRWVAGFIGRLFAGAVYGFGPFMLSLVKFHPLAGLMVASIPWLFWPAAYVGRTRRGWLSIPFSTLPFLVVILFFQASAYYRLFAIPVRARFRLVDLVSLIAPLVMVERSIALVGFYHVSLTVLIMGFSLLFAARRLGVIAVLAAGLILSFCGSFLNVSPIIWASIPLVCCSVLVGAGMQGLVSAGFADRKWILLAVTMTSALAIVTLLFATKYFQVFLGLADRYARLFTEAGKMYVVGGLVLMILFFMARAKVRLHWLRWSILCLAMAIDVFIGARFIVDRIM
jgi:hypothetical protein